MLSDVRHYSIIGVYGPGIRQFFGCTGTGNVADDMQNQIKANSLRINVLETENAKLRTTVGKMLNVATGGSGSDVADRLAAAMKVKPPPVQLWKFDSPDRLVLFILIYPSDSREIFLILCEHRSSIHGINATLET